MRPKPDYGEEVYHGSSKLAGKKAVRPIRVAVFDNRLSEVAIPY
jgi:hypothetical protein